MTSTLRRSWHFAGPLTTVFVPPPTCSTEGFNCPIACSRVVEIELGASSCLPPEKPLKVSYGDGDYYFSPGLCPAG